jgi:PIN domain nuclease of toxin-antitoxin system
VNLLLDTHVVLWWRLNSRRLRTGARDAIGAADHVLVSAASAWEVAIKIAIGRLRLEEPFAAIVDSAGFEPLPIAFSHAADLAGLAPHHADPFDRMLIAQARVEGLTLVTDDRALEPYSVPVIWT